jgi:hypothetical protein
MSYATSSTGGKYNHSHTIRVDFSKTQSYRFGVGLKYTEGESVLNNPIPSDNSSSIQPYITVFFWRRTS